MSPYLVPTEAELLEEEAELNQGSGEAGKMGGLRRRRRAYSRTMQDHVKPKGQYGQNSEQHRDGDSGTQPINPDQLSSRKLVIKLSFNWRFNCNVGSLLYIAGSKIVSIIATMMSLIVQLHP